MRGVVLAVVVLVAAVATPAVASTAPGAAEPSAPADARGAVDAQPAVDPTGHSPAFGPGEAASSPVQSPARPESPPVADDHHGRVQRAGAELLERGGAGVVQRGHAEAVEWSHAEAVEWSHAEAVERSDTGAVDGGDAAAAGDGDRPGTGVLGDGSPKGAATVTVAHELALTPERPGELRVTLRVRDRSAPGDASDTVSVGLSDRARVLNATGFDRRGERYRVDGDTVADGAPSTLTYRLPVNRTAPGGGYEAVDAGPWALVRTPSPSVRAGNATVERRYAVDGPGVVDAGLAYLGPHSVYERTVEGQHLSLVVPAAAEPRDPPSAVLESLAAAARHVRVGDRDPSVLFVAAPTTVDWAYAAQQVGDAAAWVRDDQSLHDPRNAWLHEYVHTRQAFRPTRESRWLVEGTASYYAALLSLRQGLVDHRAFRRHLLAGATPPDRDAVLAEPATWRDNRAAYRKGALVVAALDRGVRASTGGARSFQWVFGRLNARGNRVGHATLGALVAAAGGRELRPTTDRYVTEPSAPPTWEADAHRRTFGWAPPQVSTALAALRATGAGGTRTLDADGGAVVVLPGERLVASVRATNDGGRPGSVATRLWVDGTPVDRALRRVPARGYGLATVSHRFTEPGTYRVVAGGEAVRVRVIEPARSVRITDVSVDSRETGGELTVVTWVHNPRDRPARLSLPVTVDDEVVATRTVAVGPGEVRGVATTVTVDRPGRHRVVVADETAVVNVSASGTVATADPPTGVVDRPLPAGGPALPVAALVATAVAGAGAVRRRR